jgi:hypothetical protein
MGTQVQGFLLKIKDINAQKKKGAWCHARGLSVCQGTVTKIDFQQNWETDFLLVLQSTSVPHTPVEQHI